MKPASKLNELYSFLVSPSTGPGGYAQYSFDPYQIGFAGGPGGYAQLDLGRYQDDQQRINKAQMIIRQIQPNANSAQIVNAQTDLLALMQQITDPNARDRLMQQLKFQMQIAGHSESYRPRRSRRILRICHE